MAYTPYGGRLVVTASPQRIIDLLITAGLIAGPPTGGQPAFPPRSGPHQTYHIFYAKAKSDNTGITYFGHTSALAADGTWATVPLAKNEYFYENLVNGVAPLESWWVVGTANDVIYVHFVE